MKINIEVCDHERMNNFTMAEAIYDLCKSEGNDLDVISICEMLMTQHGYHDYKQSLADAENRQGYRPRRTRYQNY